MGPKVMKPESNDMTAERSDSAALTGAGAGQAPMADLPRSVEDALMTIFDNAGPPSRDMGWITQPEPVRSIRPQPLLQVKPEPQKRHRIGSSVLPIGIGVVLAAVGLLGGVYLSGNPVQRLQPPLLALQALDPKPAATPSQSISAAPPTAPGPPVSAATASPARGDQESPGPVSAPVPPPASSRLDAAAPTPAPPPMVRVVPKVAVHLPSRHDDVASAMHGLTAGCYGGGACDHHTLARADQLLATSYAEASEAGVAGATLADFRRRWDNLRNDGADAPQILVGNYAVLAHDLSRSTSAAQASRSRRSISEAQP